MSSGDEETRPGQILVIGEGKQKKLKGIIKKKKKSSKKKKKSSKKKDSKKKKVSIQTKRKKVIVDEDYQPAQEFRRITPDPPNTYQPEKARRGRPPRRGPGRPPGPPKPPKPPSARGPGRPPSGRTYGKYRGSKFTKMPKDEMDKINEEKYGSKKGTKEEPNANKKGMDGLSPEAVKGNLVNPGVRGFTTTADQWQQRRWDEQYKREIEKQYQDMVDKMNKKELDAVDKIIKELTKRGFGITEAKSVLVEEVKKKEATTSTEGVASTILKKQDGKLTEKQAKEIEDLVRTSSLEDLIDIFKSFKGDEFVQAELIRETKEEKGKLEKAQIEIVNENKRLGELVKKLEETIKTGSYDKVKAEEMIGKLNQNVSEKVAQIKDMEEQIKTLEELTKTEKDFLLKKNKNLNEQMRAFKNQLLFVMGKLEEKEEELQNVKKELIDKQEELKKALNDVIQMGADLEDTLKTGIYNEDKAAEMIEKMAQESEKRVKEIESMKQDILDLRELTKTEKDSLLKKNKELESMNRFLEKIIKGAEMALDKKEGELEEVKASLEEAQVNISKIEQELKNKENNFEDMKKQKEKEIGDLQVKLENLRASEQQTEQINEIRARLERTEDEAEIERLKEVEKELKAQINDMREEEERLVEKIKKEDFEYKNMIIMEQHNTRWLGYFDDINELLEEVEEKTRGKPRGDFVSTIRKQIAEVFNRYTDEEYTKDRIKEEMGAFDAKQFFRVLPKYLINFGLENMEKEILALPLPEDIEGAGSFLSALLPNKMPKYIAKYVAQHGDWNIIGIQVMRTPIHKAIEEVGNVLSFGKMKKTMKKRHIDEFFHLFMLITIKSPESKETKRFIYEKNERVNLIEVDINKNPKGYFDGRSVRLSAKKGGYPLAQFVLNGERAGGSHHYIYDAERANCQKFVTDVLRGNGLMTSELDKFVNQDFKGVIASPVFRGARWATDIAALGKYMVGKGSCCCDCK